MTEYSETTAWQERAERAEARLQELEDANAFLQAKVESRDARRDEARERAERAETKLAKVRELVTPHTSVAGDRRYVGYAAGMWDLATEVLRIVDGEAACEVCGEPATTIEGRTFCEDCISKLDRIYNAAMNADGEDEISAKDVAEAVRKYTLYVRTERGPSQP